VTHRQAGNPRVATLNLEQNRVGLQGNEFAARMVMLGVQHKEKNFLYIRKYIPALETLETFTGDLMIPRTAPTNGLISQ
jgi:hypothetical protein